MDIERYDVVILGSGVAGGVAAGKLRAGGLRVAVVESGLPGGTCPLRGCEPKKVFFDAVDALIRLQNHSGQGIDAQASLDWPGLVNFKKGFTDPVPGLVEQGLAKKGIDLYKGQARFLGPDSIAAGAYDIRAQNILICTGARQKDLEFNGAEHLTPSYKFFDLERPPQELVIIGGGYIAFEFAHLAIQAGVKVDMLVRSERCLKEFDPDLVKLLLDSSRRMGIRIHFQAPVNWIERSSERYLISAADGALRLETDLVLHAAGRVPNVQGLDCARGQVELDRQGIKVNSRLQSISNPRVFAAGDVVQTGPQLTPVALMEAELIVENLLSGQVKEADYTGIPSILFSHPVLTRAGLLEQECLDQGIDYRLKQADASTWSSYQRLGEQTAAVKVLYQPQSRQILGAHLLGRRFEETINVFAQAIQEGLTLDSIGQKVWAYPSFTYEVVHEALLRS